MQNPIPEPNDREMLALYTGHSARRSGTDTLNDPASPFPRYFASLVWPQA